MTPRKYTRLLHSIFKEDAREIGVFISLLSYVYMEKFDVNKTQFLKSLRNSITKLQEDNILEK